MCISLWIKVMNKSWLNPGLSLPVFPLILWKSAWLELGNPPVCLHCTTHRAHTGPGGSGLKDDMKSQRVKSVRGGVKTGPCALPSTALEMRMSNPSHTKKGLNQQCLKSIMPNHLFKIFIPNLECVIVPLEWPLYHPTAGAPMMHTPASQWLFYAAQSTQYKKIGLAPVGGEASYWLVACGCLVHHWEELM